MIKKTFCNTGTVKRMKKYDSFMVSSTKPVCVRVYPLLFCLPPIQIMDIILTKSCKINCVSFEVINPTSLENETGSVDRIRMTDYIKTG